MKYLQLDLYTIRMHNIPIKLGPQTLYVTFDLCFFNYFVFTSARETRQEERLLLRRPNIQDTPTEKVETFVLVS